MKLENLSVKRFLRLITVGLLATSFLVLLGLFSGYENLQVVLYGGLLTAVFLVWGGIFLHYFQRKLTLFTDSLCRTLDDMMDSAARPEMDYEAENAAGADQPPPGTALQHHAEGPEHGRKGKS